MGGVEWDSSSRKWSQDAGAYSAPSWTSSEKAASTASDTTPYAFRSSHSQDRWGSDHRELVATIHHPSSKHAILPVGKRESLRCCVVFTGIIRPAQRSLKGLERVEHMFVELWNSSEYTQLAKSLNLDRLPPLHHGLQVMGTRGAFTVCTLSIQHPLVTGHHSSSLLVLG